jgi:alkanesulfonate monooxygenase
MQVHWFLPTAGDSRDVSGGGISKTVSSAESLVRPPDIDYLAQVARAAEHSGFESVLTPTGTWCEDSWLTTAALTRETTRLKFMVAFRPGALSPTLAAQMSATYQRLSRGRLLINVVTGGDPTEQQRFGDWLSHDERYARTDEFLSIVRGAWTGTPYDFTGQHYTTAGAVVALPPDPVPPVFFGGASPPALAVAARQADVYLTWGEPPADVAQRLAAVRRLAEAEGREVRFGIRMHVISRDTAAEAWAHADKLLSRMDPAAIAAAQASFAKADSVGQQRMSALHGGRTADLEIYPNVWAGVGLIRGGAGTALVGSHEQVAERIEEYHALGLDHFILSGQPHLEEAYQFGEGVFPLLRQRRLTAATDLPAAS